MGVLSFIQMALLPECFFLAPLLAMCHVNKDYVVVKKSGQGDYFRAKVVLCAGQDEDIPSEHMVLKDVCDEWVIDLLRVTPLVRCEMYQAYIFQLRCFFDEITQRLFLLQRVSATLAWSFRLEPGNYNNRCTPCPRLSREVGHGFSKFAYFFLIVLLIFIFLGTANFLCQRILSFLFGEELNCPPLARLNVPIRGDVIASPVVPALARGTWRENPDTRDVELNCVFKRLPLGPLRKRQRRVLPTFLSASAPRGVAVPPQRALADLAHVLPMHPGFAGERWAA